eukprot:561704-Prymnesium_polylepis.1
MPSCTARSASCCCRPPRSRTASTSTRAPTHSRTFRSSPRRSRRRITRSARPSRATPRARPRLTGWADTCSRCGAATSCTCRRFGRTTRRATTAASR